MNRILQFSNFYEHEELLHKITIPYLVHGDLWSGNILASFDNNFCSFRAIIDADYSIWGDPEFDFPAGMINEAFSKGYGRRLLLLDYEEDSNSFIRRKLYLLYYSMKQCYKYLHIYNDKKNSDRQRQYIEQLLSPKK